MLPPASCCALVAGAVACLPLLERLVLDVLQGWRGRRFSDRPYTLHLRPLQGLLHLSDLEVVYSGGSVVEMQVGPRRAQHLDGVRHAPSVLHGLYNKEGRHSSWQRHTVTL